MCGEDNLKDHKCASEKDPMSVHLCIARELTEVTSSCDEISTSSILINIIYSRYGQLAEYVNVCICSASPK